MPVWFHGVLLGILLLRRASLYEAYGSHNHRYSDDPGPCRIQQAPLRFPMVTRGFVSRILFPTPRPSYTAETFSELIFLPKGPSAQTEDGGEPAITTDFVPCLLLTCPSARFLVLFFHTNAEDLGRCYTFCCYLRDQFQVHVLAVEYPGYGIAPGIPCGRTVMENALVAFEFATAALNWPAQNIKVFGRSIGTGPAMKLASLFSLAGVILVTPFLSVQELFRDRVGPLSSLIDEWFANDEAARKITSPTLIIHGKRDRLVGYHHGDSLYKMLKTRKLMVSPDEMEHNTNLLTKLDFFVLPMFQFFTLPDYIFRDMAAPAWAYDKQRCVKALAFPREGGASGQQKDALDSQHLAPCGTVCGRGMCAYEVDEGVIEHISGSCAVPSPRRSGPGGARGEAIRASRANRGHAQRRALQKPWLACVGAEASDAHVPDIATRGNAPGCKTVHGIFDAARKEMQRSGEAGGQVSPRELRHSSSRLELSLTDVNLEGLPCTGEPSWSHRSIQSMELGDVDVTEGEPVSREARWGYRSRHNPGRNATVPTAGESFCCNGGCDPEHAGCLHFSTGFEVVVLPEPVEAHERADSLAPLRSPTYGEGLGGHHMPLISSCCQQLPSEPLLSLAPPPPARPSKLRRSRSPPKK